MRPDTVSVLNGVVTTCFVGTWIVLGISGFFLFYLRRDVAFMRKWFPRFTILVGFLFVVFSATLSVLSSRSLGTLGVLVVVVPAVCLISWLNIKFTKFCDKCGSTVYYQNWFSPTKFCSKCGAEFDAKPSGHSGVLD
jgi:hypothetical protein